jgi:hypothetical protein
MVFFSCFMIWAYPVSEYKPRGEGTTSIWRPLFDSINYCKSSLLIDLSTHFKHLNVADYVHEILDSLRFFIRYWQGKPGTHGPAHGPTTPPFTPDNEGFEHNVKYQSRPPVRRGFSSVFGLEDYDYHPRQQYPGAQPMDHHVPGLPKNDDGQSNLPLMREQDDEDTYEEMKNSTSPKIVEDSNLESNTSPDGDPRTRYNEPAYNAY